jgi:glycosyltransferase involved in cell wall biosynthesis
MKCLVLACEFPPTTGGIANAAATFAEAMAQRGWEMEICTATTPGGDELPVSEVLKIHRLAIQGDASIWEPLAGDVSRFDEIVRVGRPDVVVIHGWQSWCVLMLPRIEKAGIPVILQSHGFGFHRVCWNPRPPFGLKVWAGYQPFIRRMPRLIKQLHALVVLSKKADRTLSFDHWCGEKSGCQNVITIPNGVAKPCGAKNDFLDYCPQARGKRIILCVANYCDRKNQLAALDVARLVPQQDIFYVFIGGEENDYSKQVRSKVAELGLSESVVVLSGLPREMTESAIAACSLALMTSKFEMQPLFLLEAMALGKPWVSTHVGSVKELQGGLVSSGAPGSLVANITSLLQDTALYSDFSEKARNQWQAEYSPEVVYDQWQNLLLSATARKH